MLTQTDGTEITTIFVHCSATRSEWWAKKPIKAVVNEIRRWHVEDRGWNDIGYHYLIHRDGSVGEGREENVQGAHAYPFNKGSIGICLLGGHGAAANDQFSQHFTSEQDTALRDLIHDINMRAGEELELKGHNEIANKACPGFQVRPWYNFGVESLPDLPTVRAPKRPEKPRSNPLMRLLKYLFG